MKKRISRTFWLSLANVVAFLAALVVVAVRILPMEGFSHGVEVPPVLAKPPQGARSPSIADIQQSPLFSPSRQPVADESLIVAGEPDPVGEPPRLAGIIREEAAARALLFDASSNMRRLVKPGEDFAGWTLVSIQGRKVEIKAGARVETIQLGTVLPKAGEMSDIAMQKKQE